MRFQWHILLLLFNSHFLESLEENTSWFRHSVKKSGPWYVCAEKENLKRNLKWAEIRLIFPLQSAKMNCFFPLKIGSPGDFPSLSKAPVLALFRLVFSGDSGAHLLDRPFDYFSPFVLLFVLSHMLELSRCWNARSSFVESEAFRAFIHT